MCFDTGVQGVMICFCFIGISFLLHFAFGISSFKVGNRLGKTISSKFFPDDNMTRYGGFIYFRFLSRLFILLQVCYLSLVRVWFRLSLCGAALGWFGHHRSVLLGSFPALWQVSFTCVHFFFLSERFLFSFSFLFHLFSLFPFLLLGPFILFYFILLRLLSKYIPLYILCVL